MAHGSRVSSSNDEVRELGARLANLAGGRFAYVSTAFLELAEPDITQGLNGCVAAGFNQVVVLPYFLAAGRHVRDDIPRIVEAFAADNPQVNVKVAPYLGRSDGLAQMLLDSLSSMDA